MNDVIYKDHSCSHTKGLWGITWQHGMTFIHHMFRDSITICSFEIALFFRSGGRHTFFFLPQGRSEYWRTNCFVQKKGGLEFDLVSKNKIGNGWTQVIFRNGKLTTNTAIKYTHVRWSVHQRNRTRLTTPEQDMQHKISCTPIDCWCRDTGVEDRSYLQQIRSF